MRLVCPSCGACHSAEAWQNDIHQRQSLAVLASMPGQCIPYALPYAAMFRQTESNRGLSWKRAASLLSELSDMIRSGHVQKKGAVARPATAGMWAEALRKMTELPPKRLPLKDHEYLKVIVWGDADDTDRRSEVSRNKAERRGNPVRREPSDSLQALPVEDRLAMMREIKAKNMGRKNA